MKNLNLNIFLVQELEAISKKINYDHQTKVMEISNLKFNQVIFNTLNYLYNLPIPENKYLKKPHWISSKNKSSVKKDIQTFKIKPQSNDGFNLFFLNIISYSCMFSCKL